ncbi:MAG TPA: pyridoxamine 5'-phosphate oxidase family protein [Xanthobacteraceae bacterium]|nr:pyridoxamine 5'-phosphate oxidase family protein [Xanthobacteraceae bacterium]
MSAPPLRRVDKMMAEARALELLARGFCGRIASVGADGWPYCVPLLYVWADGEVRVHNSAAHGHLRANVEHNPRVCFEVDEPGEVFDYGRFECDSSVAYRSVILFGTIRIVEGDPAKQAFFDALMAKYRKPDSDRPKHFYPRVGEIALYAITPERITGKETPLPAVAEQWPAMDRTKSPNAKPRPA